MTSHLEIRFPSKALRTNNAALDLAQSAEAFRDALHAALQRHLPDVQSSVSIDDAATGMSVRARTEDEASARAIEREAEDLIWVVRQ